MLLSIHLLNVSVNIDDNLLNFGHEQTNEIESIYELVVVSLLGDDYALPDSNDVSENKVNIISYYYKTHSPSIPIFYLPQESIHKFILTSIDADNIIKEITPPPPKV